MTKTIQTREEFYLQFSDEEMVELGIEKGDKFTMEANDDGSIVLKPFVSIPIDLEALSNDNLIQLIMASDKLDMTFSEYMEFILNKFVEDNE